MSRSKPIDIRDRRIPGGRLTLASRTTDALEYELRKRALYALLDEGEDGVRLLTALRARRLSLEDLTDAVTTKDPARRRSRLVALLPAPAPAEDEPTAPPPPAVMLGATVDRFLVRVKAKLRPNTYVQYEGLCRGMEADFGVVREGGTIIRDVPVVGITMEQGEGWLHGEKPSRKKGGTPAPWSAARQKVAHAVALQVWALALEADEERSERDGGPRTLTRNMWARGKARVRPPKVEKTRVLFLDRRAAGRLLWAVRGRPEGVLMALGLYAGLRAGEAMHLRRRKDVRLEARGGPELVIQSREGRYPWWAKSAHSVREVPVHRALERWIRAHVRHGYAGETYLIRAAGRDAPIAPKTQTRWSELAFRRAGIAYGRDTGDGSTFHTLRHTFASWLAQRDVQLMKIAQLMGDTADQVEQTYAHLLPKDLRAAVQRLTETTR